MIYLDNAATTMRKPPEVIDAVTEAMRSMGNEGRGSYQASLDAARNIYNVRVMLAELFHVGDASRIAFTANATESLNIAIKGTLESGDHVISTVLEHNSVLRPLYEMEKQGVEVTLLGCDEYGMPEYEAFEHTIKKNTKMILCTHGSNLTGNLIDIERIGEVAAEHNLLFAVDASQTAGVYDIDVEAQHIDILCFTGHKSLLGPQGTGGIYVREGVEIRPLKTGGSGIKTFSKRHPEEMPTALEAGTLNGHGIAGLGAALKYINRTGSDRIRQIEEDLAWSFYSRIRDISGVRVYGDYRSRNRCPIVTFNIRDCDSGMIGDELSETYSIAVRTGGALCPFDASGTGNCGSGGCAGEFFLF